MKEEILDWYKGMSFLFWKVENQNGELIATVPVEKEKDGSIKGDPEGEKLIKELSRLETLKSTGIYKVGGSAKNGTKYKYQTFVVGNPESVQMQTPNFTTPKATNPSLYGFEMAMLLGKTQTELLIQPLQTQLEQKNKELEELKKKPVEDEGLGLGKLIGAAFKEAAPEVVKQILPNMIKGVFDLANTSSSFRNLLEKVAANETVQQGIMQATEQYFKNNLKDGNAE